MQEEKKEPPQQTNSSKLGKWIKNSKKFEDEDQEEDLEPEQATKVLINEKKTKINWGERRASLVSGPKDPIVVLISNSNISVPKFEIVYKNKTKWAWKKGCYLSFLNDDETE